MPHVTYYIRGNRSSAFTLIELSIVLVIIGLIIGGILIGQDLVASARTRSVVAKMQSVQTAIITFRSKYNCLPGDCPSATSFFTGVTNGNGNQQIGGFADAADEVAGESYQIWLHLSKAEMYPGSFTGATGAGHVDRNAIPGTNVPALTEYANGGFFVGYNANQGFISGKYYNPDWTLNWTPVRANIIQIGAYPGNCCELSGYLMSAGNAFNIDKKIDDGLPVTGKLVTTHMPDGNCYTPTSNWFTPSSFAYTVQSSSITCSLAYDMGF